MRFSAHRCVLPYITIKRKTLKFPVSQPYDKPEQPKLLPGRKPIIQIEERPTQSKTRSRSFNTRKFYSSR